MDRFRSLLLFSAAFILLLVPSVAQAKKFNTATKLVECFYVTLVETMKQGPQLGFQGRYEKLDPVIRKTFNLPLMARYAVGPIWRETPKTKQKELVNAFSAFSIATYASRFTKFDDENFKVIGEKESASGTIMVETHLTPKGEEPVVLNYLVRKDKKGKLRIADVYLGATISELATRRADFTSVIKHDGFNKLIASLKKKAETMGQPPLTP